MSYPKRLLEVDVAWAQLKQQEFFYIPCNICGSFNYNPLASLLINSVEFFLVQCNECELIWRNPLPGQTFLYNLYSERYFDVAQHSPILKDQVGIADVRPENRQFRDTISDEVVRTWISLGMHQRNINGKSRKLLEIGGGRGYLQRAAQRAGWETMGLEISPHGIKEAITKEFLVFPIPLDDLCMRYVPYKKYFDVIVFYDYLEHVNDPAHVLRMINTLLADSGTIIFRIPETKGRPSLHLIDHIWHFHPDTLDILTQKENFEIYEAHYSGTFRALNGESMENITFYARKLDTSPPSRKLMIKPNPLEKWLNNYKQTEGKHK